MLFAITTILTFALILIVLAAIAMVTIYNGLVGLHKQIDRAWANIDVILKQRHDEIPGLISLCEQFAAYEQKTIQKLVQARASYGSAHSVDQKVQAATEVSSAIRGVLAIGEAYPELKSSHQFVQLQTRVSQLESQIADRRELYNDMVTNFNTRIEQFPDMFVAQTLKYQPATLFKVSEEEKTAPQLKVKLP